MSDAIIGSLDSAASIVGVLSSPATLEAVLSQGPMIINDYVFTVEAIENGYKMIARRGSEEQFIVVTNGAKGDPGYTPVKDVDYFDGDPGAPGKSAYQYAQDAGYTGTEQEFAEKLAQDSPGGGGFVVTDDGEGNVRLDLSGSVSVSDDGAGNVVIE